MSNSIPIHHAFYAFSILHLAATLWHLSKSSDPEPPKRPKRIPGANKVPIEIWREIFVHAYVPQPLRGKELHDTCICGCNSDHAFGWPFESSEENNTSKYEEEKQRFRKYHRSKLAFARISRIHWGAATEFLYRDLCIYDVRSAESLAFTIASVRAQTREAILLWAKQLRVHLIWDQIRVYQVDRLTDALSCIMYCLPDLKSVSIKVVQEPNYPHVWLRSWRKIIRHVPRNVRCLDISFWSKRLENPVLVATIDARISKLSRNRKGRKSNASTIDFPHLEFFRVESIKDPWSMGNLTHLFVTSLKITKDPYLTKTVKPAMELLHLGDEVVGEQNTIAMLFSGLPNLRVFEYHYIDHWPIATWNARFIPPSLEKVSVKTFCDDNLAWSVLYRRGGLGDWTRFCDHLRPLFIPWSSFGARGRKRAAQPISVAVILPRTNGLILVQATQFVVDYFQNIPVGLEDRPARLLVVLKRPYER